MSHFIAILLLAAAAGGCSKDYEQKKLGKDSPEGQRVRAMVESLRQGGEKGLPDALARQSAGGLSQAQAEALQASLRELIQASSVEMERFDSFGPKVYRATFTITSAGNSRTAAFLLVAQGDELRWAGRN